MRKLWVAFYNSAIVPNNSFSLHISQLTFFHDVFTVRSENYTKKKLCGEKCVSLKIFQHMIHRPKPTTRFPTVNYFTLSGNKKQNMKELFHQPTLMHNFLYSLTICLLHYYPRHVSSINMPIFRRKNCPLSTSVLCRHLQRAKISDAV